MAKSKGGIYAVVSQISEGVLYRGRVGEKKTKKRAGKKGKEKTQQGG